MPTTIIKIGGSTVGKHDTSLDDIAALHKEGRGIVLVHGGGATITEWLDKHGVESKFVRGLRATDERALDVVVAVLAGLVNKRLVAELESRGARAVGISGADAALLRARRYDAELGYVGEIVSVDAHVLERASQDAITVLAPIAVEVEGETVRPQLLNVNADTAAGEIAAALHAERLVFLTDVPGVMDASAALVPRLNEGDARRLLDDGVVQGGMVPKVQAALRAAAAGVPAAIIDGRSAGALTALFAGERVGTLVG
jgi:acetylglutamate kinase